MLEYPQLSNSIIIFITIIATSTVRKRYLHKMNAKSKHNRESSQNCRGGQYWNKTEWLTQQRENEMVISTVT